MTRVERDPPTGWTDFRLRSDCKKQLLIASWFFLIIIECLLVMTLANADLDKKILASYFTDRRER